MEGGRWEVGGDVLQQRYLPNAWSRNTNTAAVMTETEAQRKDGETETFGGGCLFRQMICLIKKREADLWLNHAY